MMALQQLSKLLALLS